jgi:hypothetical protein
MGLSGTEWLLYTAVDAQRELGIPAGTVRSWASREQLYSFGMSHDGRPMYRFRDLINLRQLSRSATMRPVGEVSPPPGFPQDRHHA